MGWCLVTIKNLVTSGCSFSDNITQKGGRWPQHIAELTGMNLYNRGHGSCGNEWIGDSLIYQIQQLLSNGVKSDEIIALVCWSGIDRKSIFVSKEETPLYDELVNFENYSNNPVYFIDSEPNKQQTARNKGWIVGGYNCSFANENINQFKKSYFENFYSAESSLVTSLKQWLMVQWWCEVNNIRLLNFTYKDIFHYPHNIEHSSKIFYDYYPDTKYYFDMLNFNNWWFHDNYTGLYEWVRDNKLEFYPDAVHPWPTAHKEFAKKILLPWVESK
jgi:hypothetical protein